MARKPTGKPNGRPPKEINWTHFEQLCGFHCTVEEISSFLNVSKETLRTHAENKYKEEEFGDSFSAIYNKFKESGKCSLRRFQFSLAQKNAAMAIWLGKQYLSQKDQINDEFRDAIVGELRTGIKELFAKQGSKVSSQSEMETKQSVSDSG